jgi:hypothetical protein
VDGRVLKGVDINLSCCPTYTTYILAWTNGSANGWIGEEGECEEQKKEKKRKNPAEHGSSSKK